MCSYTLWTTVSLVAQMVKEPACNAGVPGSIPGSGRFPGEGDGNPLQYSCLENPMDWGACWATVHGVSKSWTQLSDKHLYFQVSWDTSSFSAVRPVWAGEAGEHLEVMQGPGSAIPWVLCRFSCLYWSWLFLQWNLRKDERPIVLDERDVLC